MCSSDCAESAIHTELECPEFQRVASRLNFPIKEGVPHPFYQSVTPLRCLLLKEKFPNKWAALKVCRLLSLIFGAFEEVIFVVVTANDGPRGRQTTRYNLGSQSSEHCQLFAKHMWPGRAF